MKTNYIKYVLVLSLVILFSCETDEGQTVATLNTLVMAEEFNVDGAPNSELWNFDMGNSINGWGNNELQYYTDRPENVVVENGVLIITAQQESFDNFQFTSARINTRDKFEFQFGRVEARIQLPVGVGMWPAFWMLGANWEPLEGDDDPTTVAWPAPGEIDIMEYRGFEPTIVHGSMHAPGFSGANALTKTFRIPNDRLDSGFHIYGIEWSPDAVNFYIDDVLYNQITRAQAEEIEGANWVFDDEDQEFFILLNLAVGGDFVQNPSSADIINSGALPQRMLVDYIRVYQ
ncbi:family 16 glycosylhydrolase [Flavobacteriaceae bacterium R38]|nr:family 16 glycosylhydrolase [Flavobacteriaceae bacterium R38]